jgi:hypothetical protein
MTRAGYFGAVSDITTMSSMFHRRYAAIIFHLRGGQDSPALQRSRLRRP